jgi:hypothetical protein
MMIRRLRVIVAGLFVCVCLAGSFGNVFAGDLDYKGVLHFSPSFWGLAWLFAYIVCLNCLRSSVVALRKDHEGPIRVVDWLPALAALGVLVATTSSGTLFQDRTNFCMILLFALLILFVSRIGAPAAAEIVQNRPM